MIEVELPDGRIVSIETDDPSVAASAAKKFLVGTSDAAKAAVAEPASMPASSLSAGDYAKDMATSLAVGAGKGIIGLAGLPGDAQVAANSLGNWIDAKLGAAGVPGKKLSPEQQAYVDKYRYLGEARMPTAGEITGAVEGITGKLYEPKTIPGKFAMTTGEFLPAAAIGPGGVGGRIGSAIGAGLGSETAGQLTEGSPVEPWARLAGGLVGGMAPLAIGKMITPNPINQERARNVAVLNEAGIYPTAGQASGNESLKYAESALGNAFGSGGKTNAIETANREAATKAILAAAGEDAPRATQEVMARMAKRIGNDFETLSSRNAIVPDAQLGADFIDTAQKYVSKTLPNARVEGKKNVEGILLEIIDQMKTNGGGLPGPLYQNTRSQISGMADSVKISDPALAQALRGIRNALDSAMDRSISLYNPADSGAWREARRQWGNMKIIEAARAKAGGDVAEGLINPMQFAAAVRNNDKTAFVRGRGDYADLANAMQNVMQPMPQSGTAPRAALSALSSGAGAALGFGGGPGGAAIGATLGAAAGPAIAGRALMSPPAQAYLSNQLLARALLENSIKERAMLQSALTAPLMLREK